MKNSLMKSSLVKTDAVTPPTRPVNDPGTEPEERDPGSIPPKGGDPGPPEPPQKDPTEEPSEPGAPLPVIQDPPAPDANPIDPRVFAAG